MIFVTFDKKLIINKLSNNNMFQLIDNQFNIIYLATPIIFMYIKILFRNQNRMGNMLLGILHP